MKNEWEPIETAPKNNERLLYLARLDSEGVLQELDFDGSWEYWEESWEMSHINGYYWMSASGIEEPTHWAYQDECIPVCEKFEDVSNKTENIDTLAGHVDGEDIKTPSLDVDLINFKWREIQRLDDSYRMFPHEELAKWAYDRGVKSVTPKQVDDAVVDLLVKAYGCNNSGDVKGFIKALVRYIEGGI